jgi:hypothetical protein
MNSFYASESWVGSFDPLLQVSKTLQMLDCSKIRKFRILTLINNVSMENDKQSRLCVLNQLFFAVVGMGFTPNSAMLANTGKTSTCQK